MKAKFQTAADIENITLCKFLVKSAREAADNTIESHSILKLSAEGSRAEEIGRSTEANTRAVETIDRRLEALTRTTEANAKTKPTPKRSPNRPGQGTGDCD